MPSYIGTDSERRITLIDAIDGFECHPHFEQAPQLACVHHIDEDVSCSESPSGQMSLVVRVFHPAVVKVMKSDGKIIGFVGFSVSIERFLDGRASEVMSVEHRAEHSAGQVIRVVELQSHVAVSV